MCSGDKLILTKTGMNTLVNLLKGLMGPRDKPPLSILSCLWPNVPRTAVRGRLVFRPGWQVIAQLDMWNRRVCWRVQRLRACYSSNEMSSFHVFQVFIVQATVKQENFDWQLETTFCVSHYVTSFFVCKKNNNRAFDLHGNEGNAGRKVFVTSMESFQCIIGPIKHSWCNTRLKETQILLCAVQYVFNI